MLHRCEPLKKRRDFLRLSKSEKSFVRPSFILQADVIPPPKESPSPLSDISDSKFYRVGFTASRRVGNAVARNRAKRRLRALVRQTPFFKPGYDYVLIARVLISTYPYDSLLKDIKFSLKRLGLYEDAAQEEPLQGHEG